MISAFLVDSYKSLSPDPSTQPDPALALTNALLTQLVEASNKTAAVLAPAKAFHPAETSILVNALWFAALAISLISALLATMVQDWTRAVAVC